MNSKTIIFVLTLILAFAASGHARAQILDLEKIPHMNAMKLMDEKEFESLTKLHEEVPMGDTLLSYKIRLPENWTRGESYSPDKLPEKSVSIDILGSIARFDGPPEVNARSYFTLEALQLDYEITAESWFTNFILTNGYTIQGMNKISDRELDALYIYVENGISYMVRLAARINGPRIIVAKYYVPQFLYPKEKIMQEQAMQSFKLLNTDVKQIETRRRYDFLDQSHFDYPISWDVVNREIRTVERMRAEIYTMSESEELNGRIRVLVVSRLLDTTLSSEVERFMGSFSVKNYELGGLIKSYDFDFHPDMEFAKTEAYKLDPAVPTMMKYEFWASLLQNDDYYYIVTMLTPARDAEYFLWTKNVEAFRVVISSLRRYQ